MLDQVMYKGLIGLISGLIVCLLFTVISFIFRRAWKLFDRVTNQTPLQEFKLRFKEVVTFYMTYRSTLGIVIIGIFFFGFYTEDSYHYGLSRSVAAGTTLATLAIILLIALRWLYKYRPLPMIGTISYGVYLLFLIVSEYASDVIRYADDIEFLAGFVFVPVIVWILFDSHNKNKKHIAILSSALWFLLIAANSGLATSIILTAMPIIFIMVLYTYNDGKNYNKPSI